MKKKFVLYLLDKINRYAKHHPCNSFDHIQLNTVLKYNDSLIHSLIHLDPFVDLLKHTSFTVLKSCFPILLQYFLVTITLRALQQQILPSMILKT